MERNRYKFAGPLGVDNFAGKKEVWWFKLGANTRLTFYDGFFIYFL